MSFRSYPWRRAMNAPAGVTGPISGSQGFPHCFAASSAAVCHFSIFSSERSPPRWTCVRSLSSGTMTVDADLGGLPDDGVHRAAQGQGLAQRDSPWQRLCLLREPNLQPRVPLVRVRELADPFGALSVKGDDGGAGIRAVYRDQVVRLVGREHDLLWVGDGG